MTIGFIVCGNKDQICSLRSS